MASERTINFTLEDFAQKGGITMAALGRAVLIAAVTEIGKRWFPYAVAITPIGGVLSRRRRNRPPGLMKRSWQYFRNRDGFEVLKNYAPHATIIDRGRKKGVTPVGSKRSASHRKGVVHKDTKMLGSKQAPIGVTRAVWKRINKVERFDISRKAIATAEASFQKAA